MNVEDTLRARGVVATVPKKTHIPGANGKTFCGRDRAKVACINLAKDAIDDATCKVCTSSDDRMTREQYMKSDEYKRQRAEERGSR